MTPVRNIYAPVGIDAHNYLGQRRRVRNGILDEVPDRVLDGVRVPFHHHRLVGVDGWSASEEYQRMHTAPLLRCP